MKQCPFIKLDRVWLRSALLCAGCGVFLASILAIKAGDSIKFSPSGDDVALPENNTKEHKIDGPIKHGSDELPGMYELPTASPSSPSSSVLFNNKKLQELIDQRKNWIYMTPEMSMESSPFAPEKEKSSKEAVSELFDNGGKSKKVVERYMENQEQQSISRSQANASRLDEELNLGADGKSKNAGKTSNSSETAIANPGFNNPMSENSLSSPMQGASGLGLSRKSFGYQDYTTQLRTESDLRFQQLLRPTANKTSMSGTSSDPMRMLVDGTSQEMQPVTGKSLEAIAAEKKKSMTGLFGDPNQSAFPRSFGSVDSTIVGASSLSPAIIAPTSTSPLMAQPAVLPLPKRKF
jgi:hypothetical protein